MRQWILAAGFAVAATAAGAQGTRSTMIPHCPIVDGGRDPLGSASVGWAPAKAIEDTGEDFGFFDFAGQVSLGYYRTAAGDFDLSVAGHLWTPTDGDNYDVPDSFGQGYLRLRWDIRTTQGLTLRAEARPGYYAEVAHLEWSDFNLPFSLSGIQAFNKQFAVQGGVAIHPGYAFDPILGLRFVPHRDLVMDLAYPESRLYWHVHPVFALLGGYQVNRMWIFSLSEDDPGEDFILRDQRLYGGFDLTLGGLMTLTARGGMLLGRELDFTHGDDTKAEVDEGFFVSFGIAGEF